MWRRRGRAPPPPPSPPPPPPPRRGDLLSGEEGLGRTHLPRRARPSRKPVEAMEILLERLRLTNTNAEFLKGLGERS